MRLNVFQCVYFLIVLSLFSACANVIPPNGGKTDTTPPKLLRITPKDSLLNTRVTRIEMKFDEFITVSDVSKELHISPTLTQTPTMTVAGKTVIVKIPDSLLQENTTYTINFGKSIRDLHESNAYEGKNFMFSTGPWFDSLKMKGIIMDAASGRIDSSGSTKVLLYEAKSAFDVVTRQNPSYVTSVSSNGSFVLDGLPDRAFRIFALKEAGDDLRFNDDNELIGFADTTYFPGKDSLPIVLSIFKEMPDTSRVKPDSNQVSVGKKKRSAASAPAGVSAPSLDAKTFNYKAETDTNNIDKRTQDITLPLTVFTSRKITTLNESRIFLSADSNGIEVEQKFTASVDTGKMKLEITTTWLPNTLYTLRLLKSFVADSSNTEAMPSKYIFRTKSEDDYGKMEINVPEKYVGKPYLLEVKRDADSVYLNPITSSKTLLKLLPPGTYSIIIIEDKNGDLEWSTGELKTKRHAERVVPFTNTVMMKAGWEHVVDFEPKKK